MVMNVLIFGTHVSVVILPLMKMMICTVVFVATNLVDAKV